VNTKNITNRHIAEDWLKLSDGVYSAIQMAI